MLDVTSDSDMTHGLIRLLTVYKSSLKPGFTKALSNLIPFHHESIFNDDPIILDLLKFYLLNPDCDFESLESLEAFIIADAPDQTEAYLALIRGAKMRDEVVTVSDINNWFSFKKGQHPKAVSRNIAQKFYQIVSSDYKDPITKRKLSGTEDAIQFILENIHTIRVPGQLPYYTYSENEVFCKPQWIVKGLFPRKCCSIWFGLPGCGKSTIVLDILKRIGDGKQIFNVYDPPKTPINTLYAFADQPREHFESHYLRRFRLKENQVSYVYPLEFDNYSIHMLEHTARERKADFIIIDTLSTFFNLKDENDNSALIRVMKQILSLSHATNSHVLILDHARKPSSSKMNKAPILDENDLVGGGAKSRIAAYTMVVNKKFMDGSPITGSGSITLGKAGVLPDFPSCDYEICDGDDDNPASEIVYTKSDTASVMSGRDIIRQDRKNKVLAYCNNPCTAEDIERDLAIPHATVYRLLKELVYEDKKLMKLNDRYVTKGPHILNDIPTDIA